MSARATPVVNREALVGAAVFLVAAVLIAWSSLGGRASLSSGYEVEARFDQVDGVTVGTPVYLAGLQVGEVAAVRLERRTLKPLLTIRIREQIGIPVDSAVLIMSDGVLGGKFVKIEPGAEDEAMTAGAQFEFSQSSIILEQVLERVVNTAEARLRAPARPDPNKTGPSGGDPVKPENKEPK